MSLQLRHLLSIAVTTGQGKKTGDLYDVGSEVIIPPYIRFYFNHRDKEVKSFMLSLSRSQATENRRVKSAQLSVNSNALAL